MKDLGDLIRARRGEPPHWPVCTTAALQRDWRFEPSPPGTLAWLLRQRARWLRRKPAPPSQVLRAVGPRPRWTAMFLYLAQGGLTASHRYTLARLRDTGAGVLAVCATPTPQEVPPSLLDLADAVIWKGLSGFDFSAYALAIDAIAGRSPGADLLVVNDSVLGPFGDLAPVLARMPWQLSGFTASGQVENHLQSYAFHLRGVEASTLAALGTVLSPRFAYDRYRDVIYAQETRFARTAARRMSAGALWYGPAAMGDPSVHAALSLAQEGFPFLKRKLFLRDAGIHQQQDLLAILEEHGHPRP